MFLAKTFKLKKNYRKNHQNIGKESWYYCNKMGGLKDYSKKPLFSGSTRTDTFYFVYLLLHIPITVLIDSALAIPQQYQLQVQKTLINFHISQNKDFLLAAPPTWLTFFGWIELTLQLPFFVLGAVALYKSKLFESMCGSNEILTYMHRNNKDISIPRGLWIRS